MSKDLVEEYTTSECWERNHDAKRLLQSLKHRGFSVGIISNFDERLKSLLHHMELLKLVDFVICSYEVKCFKPDKRIFNLALLACPEVREEWECTHVGDDPVNDYQGAREAGWNALILADNPESEKLKKVPKEHIVTDILTVRDFMLNQLK
jgi:FMN phosphatase YigB (HAD superfamily)